MKANMSVLLLVCGVAVVAVLGAPAPSDTPASRCGNDLAAQAFPPSRHRRDAASMDARYRLPSEPVALSPPCAYEDGGVGQYGMSQCHIRRVMDGYMSTTDWPRTDLTLGVISYAPASGSPWITATQVTSAVSVLNQAYSSANINFVHTFNQKTDQAMFDSLTNTPVSVSSLDSLFATLAQDFTISSRQADRQFAVYLAVLPTNWNEFIGLCFPIPGMLQEITNTIPTHAGGVCIVDPAFVLYPDISANANEQSRGLTPAHEIGHALGLQHPHNDVSQPRQYSSNPPRFYGCTGSSASSDCIPTSNSYDTGDFISDLPPVPNPIAYTNVFDTASCQPTSRFPAVCGSSDRDFSADVRNYMSYFPETCTDSFTPMQIARMRCVIDRFLLPVTSLVPTSNRILPPVAMVTARLLNETRARIEWSPPLHLLFYSDTRPSTLTTPSDISYVLERVPPLAGGPAIFQGDVRSYLDETLTANLTYTYRVFVRTLQGDGAHSGYMTATFGTSAAWSTLLSLPLAVAVVMMAFLV